MVDAWDSVEHVDDPDEDGPCSRDATCASGGTTHCHQYELYPEALDDAGDGCCVAGCFLDTNESR